MFFFSFFHFYCVLFCKKMVSTFTGNSNTVKNSSYRELNLDSDSYIHNPFNTRSIQY